MDRAVSAGAIGVLIGLVAPGDAVSFSYGGGTNFAPTLVISVAVKRIKTQLSGGQTVNVYDFASRCDPAVGSMAGSSSRGPSISGQSIKPEIGGPGLGIGGSRGRARARQPYGGTSGASRWLPAPQP